MPVQDSESRRFELNIWVSFSFFSGRSWPKICSGVFFGGGGVTLKVWIFCVKICAHSERNLNLMARVFEMRRIIEVREKMCFACTGEVDQSDQHGLFVPV